MNGKNNNDLADKLYGYKEKWDHFWQYYKIQFFVGLGVVIALIFLISQCAGRVVPDANVVYIGRQLISNMDKSILSEDEIVLSYTDVSDDLTKILDEDLNGDGKISVKFITYWYSPGMAGATDTKRLINLEFMSGDSVIYFMDRSVYNELRGEGQFVAFEDAIGYTPDKAIDAYHIKLSDLPVSEHFMSLALFPEGTVVAIRGPQTANVSASRDKHEKRHERNHMYMKKLVEYAPE